MQLDVSLQFLSNKTACLKAKNNFTSNLYILVITFPRHLIKLNYTEIKKSINNMDRE